MSDAAVEVRGLVKSYGERAAVRDVTFSAARGAVTAIIGPNGAGKTTTVECCAGLRRADGGHIAVLGQQPGRRELRTRVGVMPQSAGSGACGVYPSARVGEVLRLYASYAVHPLDPDALLDRLGLMRVVKTPWRRLSGGEQQRLSLALAIVGRPELVFLDEPTAGLDVHARHSTWALIEDLRASGVTVVLTTHAMDEAERLADHVVVISAGRVVAAGSPRELATTETVTFQTTPGLPVAGFGPNLRETNPGQYVVEGASGAAAVAAVAAWCAQHGAVPDNIRTHGSLEDVYLALTAEAGES